jgi:hypothetical protein
MPHRVTSVGIVALWVAAMAWLVWEKVLPTLLIGDPPTYAEILENELPANVSWDLLWNERPLGWASSRTLRQHDGVTFMQSHVHFNELPISDLATGVFSVLAGALEAAKNLPLDAESSVQVDPLGRLIGFDSALHLGDVRDVVKVRGAADGERLQLSVRAGDFNATPSIYLPPKTMVGDALTPQPRLPNLRVGQTWTEPVYSPFRPPTEPMEILVATVERRVHIVWEREAVPCSMVVYMTDPGSAVASQPVIRGTVWVRDDGTVLKQEVRLLNSRLTFVRSLAPR